MGKFDVKNAEKAPLGAKKMEGGLLSGILFGVKFLLGRANLSTIYKSSFTVGKGTRGVDFRNAYE